MNIGIFISRFFLLLFAFVIILFSSCDDGFNDCPDATFEQIPFKVSNKFFIESNDSISYTNGTSESFMTGREVRFENDFELDENDCFIGQSDKMKIIITESDNSLYSELILLGQANNTASGTILVNSRTFNANNTFNQFKFSANQDAEMIPSNDYSMIDLLEINGNIYFDVIKFSRPPNIPNSDLDEIIELYFNLDNGIISTETESGLTLYQI